MQKVVASWSGGKDSSLALHSALEQGVKVDFLLNFVNEKFDRVSFHGVPSKFIGVQAEAIGIKLVQKKIDPFKYEKEFISALRELRERGARCLVTGDIDMPGSREWVEKVCRKTRLQPLMPLWGQNPTALMEKFIQSGFEATVVSANSKFFSKEFVGRRIDAAFVKDLTELNKKHKIHLHGEQGEYHSFVTNGPIFKKQLKIKPGKKVLKSGYWFQDIKECV